MQVVGFERTEVLISVVGRINHIKKAHRNRGVGNNGASVKVGSPVCDANF